MSISFPGESAHYRAARSLLLQQEVELPCPSCTQFLDFFDGVAEHAGQRINVAVVVRTALSRVVAHGENRDWRRLRLLSSAGITYNRD